MGALMMLVSGSGLCAEAYTLLEIHTESHGRCIFNCHTATPCMDGGAESGATGEEVGRVLQDSGTVWMWY